MFAFRAERKYHNCIIMNLNEKKNFPIRANFSVYFNSRHRQTKCFSGHSFISINHERKSWRWVEGKRNLPSCYLLGNQLKISGLDKKINSHNSNSASNFFLLPLSENIECFSYLNKYDGKDKKKQAKKGYSVYSFLNKIHGLRIIKYWLFQCSWVHGRKRERKLDGKSRKVNQTFAFELKSRRSKATRTLLCFVEFTQ